MTINEREIKKDWGFLNTTWIIASLAMSLTGSTVLVVIERYTKMKKAVVVPSKGSTGSYAARMVIELINECGDKDQDVILKTDQEAAIKFFVDDVCVNRTGARTIKECAPQGSKGSNGIVERAVQSVEQCLRTLAALTEATVGPRGGVEDTCPAGRKTRVVVSNNVRPCTTK